MKLIEPFMDALMLDIEATAAQLRRAGLRPVSLYTVSYTHLDVYKRQPMGFCAPVRTMGLGLSWTR